MMFVQKVLEECLLTDAILVPEVYYYKCDLSDLGAIGGVCTEIKNRLGNPSVLINNAGIGG